VRFRLYSVSSTFRSRIVSSLVGKDSVAIQKAANAAKQVNLIDFDDPDPTEGLADLSIAEPGTSSSASNDLAGLIDSTPSTSVPPQPSGPGGLPLGLFDSPSLAASSFQTSTPPVLAWGAPTSAPAPAGTIQLPSSRPISSPIPPLQSNTTSPPPPRTTAQPPAASQPSSQQKDPFGDLVDLF
jgi:hypothetical protein